VHLVARQPIIIVIVASKPMATIYKQKIPSKISKYYINGCHGNMDIHTDGNLKIIYE